MLAVAFCTLVAEHVSVNSATTAQSPVVVGVGAVKVAVNSFHVAAWPLRALTIVEPHDCVQGTRTTRCRVHCCWRRWRRWLLKLCARAKRLCARP